MQYEDLDEVMARYVEPMAGHVKDLLAYRKFLKGSRDEVDDAARQAAYERVLQSAAAVFASSTATRRTSSTVGWQEWPAPTTASDATGTPHAIADATLTARAVCSDAPPLLAAAVLWLELRSFLWLPLPLPPSRDANIVTRDVSERGALYTP